jgi:hypothetical protein
VDVRDNWTSEIERIARSRPFAALRSACVRMLTAE